MKRLLLLTMIIGSFQLSFGQKDKTEGLKKISSNSQTEDILDLSVLEEMEELAELSELSELSSLSQLSELSELSSLAALSSLSALADENNAEVLEELGVILGKEMEVMLKSLENIDIDLDPDVDIDFDRDMDIDIDVDEMVDMNELMDIIHDVMKNIEIRDVPDDN